MSPQEVARVLALVAVAEKIEIDQVLISFWMNTLAVHEITEPEFRAAVVRHYATSTYPIRPAHIWQIVKPERDRTVVDQALLAEQERAKQFALAQQAEASGDWTAFDALYPWWRTEQVQKDLDYWKRMGLEPPAQTVELAIELGVTPPQVEG